MSRPAVFFDRDGTLNVEVHFLSDPKQLELLPTVAETIALLNQRNIAAVAVTNQAGIARGYFAEDRLREIHEELQRLLGLHDARLDGIYYCPHHPTEGLGQYRIECECRKPLPGLLTKAACDLDINLAKSLMIGDRISDLQAGASAGCRTALVRTGYGAEASHRIDLEAVHGIGIFNQVGEAVACWLPQKSC